PSARMSQYLQNWSVPARAAVLERETGPPADASCETCGRDIQTGEECAYRCFDCFHPCLECRSCAVLYHRRNPFHRVERWDRAAGFWERISLGELQLTINLGHQRGVPCPLNPGTRRVTVVHSHGIHTYNLRFCLCPQPDTLLKTPEPIQLIRHGMWPGSWKQPATAYTISCLRDHHLLSLQSQISAQDYVTYLERCTDNVCPSDVTDRYREFMIAAREFSFMRMTKRFDVQPSDALEAGCLAVLCPACPQPGINMDPRWDGGRPEGQEFIDALFHTTDGNFQQNQKMKPLDPDDVALTMGACFFANEKDFATYQSLRTNVTKESTTCHKFGAMGYGTYTGRVSGTVGLSCARHMFVLPTGTVDLTAGEAYAYVDWVQLCGLQRWMKLRLHVAGYDINCQYRINFASRMQSIRERFSFLSSIPYTHFPPTLIAVGKFHLAAHIPSCRFKFSYNFLPGVGMTDGEASERIWADGNELASNSKEMTSGHRHDYHNDAYNDFNVRKVHSMPRELTRKYVRAEKQHAAAEAHLASVSAGMKPEDVEVMKAEEKAWLAAVVDMKNHKTLTNPYELSIERAPTTKELLASAAKTRTHAGRDAMGVLDTVDDLLDAIEDSDGTEDTLHELTTAKNELLGRIADWTENYNMYLQPALEHAAQDVVDNLADVRPSPLHERFPLREQPVPMPEITGRIARAELGLPPIRSATKKDEIWQEVVALDIPLASSFDARVLEQEAVEALVGWEKKVRESQANDALNDLRTHIVTTEVLKLKKIEAPDTRMTTRMGKKIRRKHDEVVAAADEYRRARVALVALGMDEQDPFFRPLRKRDLTKFTMSSEHQTLGESSKGVSWIWEDFSFVDAGSQDERQQAFMREVRRVHWFRTSALYQRWAEEKKLVTEEMFRTVRFFRHFRLRWSGTAQGYEAAGEKAAAAYAKK
ncbi:hypothetical protein OH76DRAFT_1356862, partial [Lentinus brumalis]